MALEQKNFEDIVTFTRASEATFVDSDGLIKTVLANQPRFDHDPVTGEPLGLLVEESRTNLCPRSEDFITGRQENGMITSETSEKIRGRTVNLFTGAADGRIRTFYRFNETIIPANTVFCYSFVCKKKNDNAESFSLGLEIFGVKLGAVKFHFNSKEVIAVNAANFGPVIISTDVTELRENAFLIKVISNSRDENIQLSPFFITQPNAQFLFGQLQIELGSFPTSYIPTNGSQVTRVADSAKIDGAVFESFYNGEEGTLFFDFRRIGTDFFRDVYEISENGSISNRFFFETINKSPSYQSVFSQDSNSRFFVDDVPSGMRVAVKFTNINQYDLYVNGNFIGSKNSISANTLLWNTLVFDDGSFIYKAIKFFPRALSDSELIELTTPETQP